MIRNSYRAALLSSLVASAVFGVAPANADTLALKGGNLYASPDATVVADAVVVVSDGVISAVGKPSEVPIAAGARMIDCAGTSKT